MLRENIIEIIDSLNDLDERDVLKESIKERLDQSLLLYYDELDKAYNRLLDEEYSALIKRIIDSRGDILSDEN